MNINKKYITCMFPYPSGSGLHIGHWYNYAIVDSYCKILKYQGIEVFQPFGFDSFGLPAENYAKKIGGDPKLITEQNIINFTKEINRMNTSFDIKFSTHSIFYQEKTKWLFNKLLKHGLAYKAIREQNYCESCETVLANEQVINNKCERCDTLIVQKKLSQWFFKITDYRQRLYDDLDKVDYPEKTKKQQRNWLEEGKFTDWCVSRQRKWGCPIPVENETDTLDTFVDSSFYTLIYDKYRPVDIYIGGNEHACMHLIFSRFICKFLYDIGEISFDEPFKQVIHQGMILKDGEKMSKSKGNIIDPTLYEPQDLRIYLMFINHYFDGGSWNDNNFKGVQKFVKRIKVWTSKSYDNEINDIDKSFEIFKNKIFENFEKWKVNKVVSEWMIFYNTNKNINLTKKQSTDILDFFNTCF